MHLLDGALTVKNLQGVKAQAAIVEAASQFDDDLLRGRLPLQGCFPLHPLVALLVGPLFRQVGQNERSVFAFLSSREPNGLADWLQRADGERPHELADLFDYVTATAPPGSLTARVWTSTEHAIRRLPADTPADAVRLLKAIALLQLVGSVADLRADKTTLKSALNTSDERLEQHLSRLRGASTIVYRRFKQAFELWDGSDLDVEQLVAEHRERVLTEGGLAQQVDRTVDPAPIVANRHYLQAGTLRALPVRYLSDLSGLASHPWGADGGLFILLPDDPHELSDLAQAIKGYRPATGAPPITLVLADGGGVLHDLALEYLAADSALRRTPQLESVPIARRMLDERRQASLQALQRAHRALVSGEPSRPATLWVKGAAIEVTGRPAQQASRLFDATFAQAPKILNELVNRQSLSSAAARAQRIVMQRLLTHSAEQRLGIEGHPPELSIYLSVLHRSGLHGARQDGTYGLKPPAEGSALAAFWTWLDETLAAAEGGRVTFERLVEAAAAPPFGVRDGVAKVLIFVWSLQRADQVFLYEENSFVPSPSEALVERLLRQPALVELQAAALSGAVAQVAEAIHAHCFPHMDPTRGRMTLRIVAQLMRTIRELSAFAQQAAHVSREAAAVRAAILGARDNLRLLRVGLPRAIDPSLPEGALPDAGIFGPRLQSALEELKQADGWLHGQIEARLLALLERAHPGDDAAELNALADRARRVLALPNLDPMTEQFALLTAELQAQDPNARNVWQQAIGRAIMGKSPAAWRDADLERFALRAEDRIRAFRAAERLAFTQAQQADPGGVRLARLDFVDSSGAHHGQFGVVPADVDVTPLVAQARAHIANLRAEAQRLRQNDTGVAYAPLTATMAELT